MQSVRFLAKYQGLLRREVHRFCKVPLQTIGTPIVSALLYILIFGISLGSDGYLAFLLPGLIAMSLVKNAFENASSSLVASKYVNELQDLRVTPLTRQNIVWAIATASFLRGLFVAFLTYMIGWFFYHLPITHPIGLFFFLSSSGLTFGFLGITIAMKARSFEHIGAMSSFVLVPLIYLGGTFFSLSRLSPLWQTVSKYNPLFYIINGVRYSLVETSDVSLASCALVATCALILSYALAVRALRPGTAYMRSL